MLVVKDGLAEYEMRLNALDSCLFFQRLFFLALDSCAVYVLGIISHGFRDNMFLGMHVKWAGGYMV